MYNLLIALAVGLLAGGAVLPFGFSPWAALVPGVLGFLATYLVLARRIVTKVQGLSALVQKELSALPPNERERKQRIERAVKILEDGLHWGKWQFLIAPELHGQIAMILYMVKDYDRAQAHFAKSSRRNGFVLAMHGALYFQRKDFQKMEEAFEIAVRAGKKESIVWAAYAWCLSQMKNREKAIAVLGRGVAQNPSDEKLKSSLQALQNDKKLKMKAYEPMWWQFGLETPPMQMAGGPRVRYMRR